MINPSEDPNRVKFAEAMKDQIDEIESVLGEFGTYLLECVAACKQSGGSDLFTLEEAVEIMEYVQLLNDELGDRAGPKGTAQSIQEGLPEIMELYGIVKTVKSAMEQDLCVEKDLIKRYFYLSARVSNFVRVQIDETGV